MKPSVLKPCFTRPSASYSTAHVPSKIQRAAATVGFARNRIFSTAATQTEKLSHGNYPAPMRLIDVVRSGYEHGPAAGLEAERRALTELMETEAAKNLTRLFFLRQGAKRNLSQQIPAKPRD